MGNRLFVTRPPETGTLSTPLVRTPFSDVTSQIGHFDGDARCFPFQLRFIDCCEAYGREMAKVKCKYLFQDITECSNMWKQRARLSNMMERRYQLWLQGLRGLGPKRNLFHETPRYDGFVPNFLLDDKHYKP